MSRGGDSPWCCRLGLRPSAGGEDLPGGVQASSLQAGSRRAASRRGRGDRRPAGRSSRRREMRPAGTSLQAGEQGDRRGRAARPHRTRRGGGRGARPAGEVPSGAPSQARRTSSSGICEREQVLYFPRVPNFPAPDAISARASVATEISTREAASSAYTPTSSA